MKPRRYRMLRKYHDIAQNDDEWDELRLGRFTASAFKDLFMGKKTKGYEEAIYLPVFERITNQTPDSFYGKYMERGHELEPFAIERYEMDNFIEIENGGFWTLGEWIGASPDGLIGKEGLFESKAPKFNTHMKYLRDKELPELYYWQVHGQMYVTDRSWVDFYSYHPGIKPLCIRVHREEKIEQELITKLNESIEMAQEILNELSEDELQQAA